MMNKGQSKNDFTDWYSIWLNQSRAFYESANQHLQKLFETQQEFNPEEHADQVKAWLESMKKQWDFTNLSKNQGDFAQYWQSIAQVSAEASDMLLQEWIKRAREHNPVKSTKELYEMWLNCCQSIYQESLKNEQYHHNYSDFVNTAMKFWKSYNSDK